MTESPTIGKLAEALAKAQAQMGPAIKAAKNPFYKSTYAKLEDVIEAIRVPLSSNGLSWVQPLQEEGDSTYLVTKLMHISGEWVSGRMKLIPMKKDMQGMAGAITYAKRFSLSAMVGLAEEDDDGNSTIHKPAPQTQAVKPDKKAILHGLMQKTGWEKEELARTIERISNGKTCLAGTLDDKQFQTLIEIMEGSPSE